MADDRHENLKRKRDAADETQQQQQQPGVKMTRATPVLVRELRQWRFARSLVDVLLRGNGRMFFSQEKSRSEACNVLDRWLLSFQLDYDISAMHPRYPLFPQRLCPQDPVNQKLMDECMEKRFSSDEANARRIFDELDGRLRRFLDKKVDDDADTDEASRLRVQLVEDAKTEEAHVVVADFKSKHCWRVRFLVRNFGLMPTARMLLRYEALGTGSLQWGEPITVHNAMHRHVAARYEGFASPLNSWTIDKPDGRFCSLFLDTDAAFGSMGSFFKVDFDKCEGGWAINPPFIEKLMDRVATKVLNYLQDGGSKNWFLITLPRWTDASGWARLAQSSLLVDKIELTDGCFMMQDSYGRVFNPRNKVTIFLLALNKPNLKSSLSQIEQAYRSKDMAYVQAEWQRTCRKELASSRTEAGRTLQAAPDADRQQPGGSAADTAEAKLARPVLTAARNRQKVFAKPDILEDAKDEAPSKQVETSDD